MKIILRNEEIELFPEKALFWPKAKILALSDVHIGKAESFQQFGVPVPSGSHLEDLERMTKLIDITKAEKVFVLGDWIHKKNSWTPNIIHDLTEFFKKHQNVDWTLLVGNHERGSVKELKNFPMNVVEGDLTVPPFCFTHGHLDKKTKDFIIQGHVHPVVRLRGGGTNLRLPCFLIEKDSLTLPSFGSLTGGFEIRPAKGQKVFVPTEENVVEIPFF